MVDHRRLGLPPRRNPEWRLARDRKSRTEFWMVLLDSNNLVVGWGHSKKKKLGKSIPSLNHYSWMVNTLTDVGYSVRYSSFGSEIRRFACQMAISLLMYPQLCQLYTGPKLHYRHVLYQDHHRWQNQRDEHCVFSGFFHVFEMQMWGKTHTLDKSISSFNLFFTVLVLMRLRALKLRR